MDAITYKPISDRGIDGGKKFPGVKVHVAVDKFGVPLAIDVSLANRHDPKGIVPVLRTFAEGWIPRCGARPPGLPSRRLPVAATAGSSRPASAGWLNGPSPG
jgi:Transposase DDE domain